MKNYILQIILATLLPSLCIAEPIVLKCTTDDGQKAADLIIDLPNKTMTWAIFNYDIVHENETYITAYERTNNIGGEVWVIDRNTGEYHRGSVGIYLTENQTTDQGKFVANTYSGYCRKQQF